MIRRAFLRLPAVAVPLLSHGEPLEPRRRIRLFNGRNLEGWSIWLRDSKREDPKGVFGVAGGMLRISGEEWGGIATLAEYRNYRLVTEWKWGEKTWGNRVKAARDSGILLHCVGPDGAASGVWMESIECQIIEGGTGDIILVKGENAPALTADVRIGPDNQPYWQRGGVPKRMDKGRFNWYGRDPQWKDVLGFRGAQDVEKPHGEWNRLEVICDSARITNILNGVTVNEGYDSTHTAGKIQIQSEGAEIFFRRIELHPLKLR